MVMVVGSKKKERTVKGNWCNPAKDPPTIKSIFSLERKDGKKVNDRTYLKWMVLAPFIKSFKWVYFFRFTTIMGDVSS